MPPTLRESPTQALYRAALGPVQSEHHLRAFERFDALGAAAPSWNWAAALLTLNWLVYRRLWRLAGLYLALVLLAGGLLWGLAWGRLPDGVTLGLAAAAAVLATVVPGLYGNAWLHGQLRLALVAAARESPSLADTVDTLRRRAPSLARLGALVLVNVLLGALLASAWLTGQAAGAHASAPMDKRALPAPVHSSVPAPATVLADAPATGVAAVSEPAPLTVAAAVTADKPEWPPAEAEGVAPKPVMPVPPLEAAPAPTAMAAAPASQAPSTPVRAPKLEPGAAPSPAAPLPSASAPAAVPSSGRSSGPSSATASGPYVINVGLFADPTNAERALSRIRQAGLPASADRLTLERGPRTRVRAGPFARRAEAERAAARIRALGLEARVVSPERPARPPG